MNKIIKCNLGVQYVAEDADAKNIYVTIIYYDDCLKRRERVRLTYTNIMQLLSSWGACQGEDALWRKIFIIRAAEKIWVGSYHWC